MCTLHAQSFLYKDPGIVRTYHAFTLTHARTHLHSNDSPMSEYIGMSGIVSLQHSCLLHRKYTGTPGLVWRQGGVSGSTQNKNEKKKFPTQESDFLDRRVVQNRFPSSSPLSAQPEPSALVSQDQMRPNPLQDNPARTTLLCEHLNSESSRFSLLCLCCQAA